jgi:hypothetical protein
MMIRSTYHTVLTASPGAAKFERDMLFDIPFIADWRKIGDYRQRQTDLNNLRKNVLIMIIKLAENTCTERRYSPQNTF